MRDYNYRKEMEKKETKRKSMISKLGYVPTRPYAKRDKNNNVYYVSYHCKTKKYIKKKANRAVRRAPYGSVGNGSNYIKVYDLDWEWY